MEGHKGVSRTPRQAAEEFDFLCHGFHHDVIIKEKQDLYTFYVWCFLVDCCWVLVFSQPRRPFEVFHFCLLVFLHMCKLCLKSQGKDYRGNSTDAKLFYPKARFIF